MTPPEEHDDDDGSHCPQGARKWGPHGCYFEVENVPEVNQSASPPSPPVPVSARVMTRIMQLRYHGQTQDFGRPLENPPVEWCTAYCKGEGRGVVNLLMQGGFNLKDVLPGWCNDGKFWNWVWYPDYFS